MWAGGGARYGQPRDSGPFRRRRVPGSWAGDSGNSGRTGRGRADTAPGSGIAGSRWRDLRDAGRAASGTGVLRGSGITGRGCAPARSPDPGLRVRDGGIGGTRAGGVSRFARGGRDARAPGIGEFRDNRAGRRAGAVPGSGIAGSGLRDLRDAGRAGFRDGGSSGVPGQPGGAARRHRRCRRGRRRSQGRSVGGIGPCTRLANCTFGIPGEVPHRGAACRRGGVRRRAPEASGSPTH